MLKHQESSRRVDLGTHKEGYSRSIAGQESGGPGRKTRTCRQPCSLAPVASASNNGPLLRYDAGGNCSSSSHRMGAIFAGLWGRLLTCDAEALTLPVVAAEGAVLAPPLSACPTAPPRLGGPGWKRPRLCDWLMLSTFWMPISPPKDRPQKSSFSSVLASAVKTDVAFSHGMLTDPPIHRKMDTVFQI